MSVLPRRPLSQSSPEPTSRMIPASGHTETQQLDSDDGATAWVSVRITARQACQLLADVSFFDKTRTDGALGEALCIQGSVDAGLNVALFKFNSNS